MPCTTPSARLRIGLVITAHPTEIMRRTLQHKYNVIAEALAELDRPDLTLGRARRAHRHAAPRDCRRLGDRGGAARAPVSARRGPIRAGGVRGNALGRAAAVPARARSHAGARDRPRPAARRRADPVRILDRRGSRRKPVGDAGRDPPRVPDGAMDGADVVREGNRSPALRPLDDGGDPGAAGAGGRRLRAVPRGASRRAAPAGRDPRPGRARPCSSRSGRCHGRHG